MAYKIAIVDDEEDDLKHVCHHISDFFSSTDIEVNTESVSDDTDKQ